MSQHRPGLSSTAYPFYRHGSLTVPSKTCWHLCLKAPLPCRYPSAFLRVPPRRLDPTPQFPSRGRAGRSRSPCPAPGAHGAAAAEPGGALALLRPPRQRTGSGMPGESRCPLSACSRALAAGFVAVSAALPPPATRGGGRSLLWPVPKSGREGK